MVVVGCPGHGGGVFYNSNLSAEYIRSFDRNSAIDDADCVAYNMAGTVRLRPGLSFNVSNQSILQRATVRTQGNPVLGDRTYTSRNPVWLVPNIYVAYRKGRWAVFTALETMGATAVRRWRDGLPSLDLAGKQAAGYGGAASGLIGADAYVAAASAGAGPAQAQAAEVAARLDPTPFPSSSWLKGSSRWMAWRHGAAYRFGPRLALAVAGRLVWACQDVTGGAAGASTYNQYGHDLRARSVTLVDVSSRAVGYSGEIGINLYPNPDLVLDLGFEMATALRFRTSVRGGADGAGRFVDGQEARLDLPRTWRLGLGWQLTPKLRASLGLNAYLEHAARMGLLDDPTDRIVARRDYRNTYEQAAALEYQLDPRWLLSVGVNVNQIGQRRSATLDISLPGAHNNYLSLGTGFRYQASDRLRFNLGVACTGFAHHYRNADVQGDQALQAGFQAQGVAISPAKAYDKRYLILAVGLDYHLPL
jgi:long-subunit fatty acid transport protein